LFGGHKGHNVKAEKEAQEMMKHHTQQLKLMNPELEQMSKELSEKQNYWKFMDKYRAKKEELKTHIQTEFRRWRKELRAVEMKVLDKLHTGSFNMIEEQFTKARESNQKLLNEIIQMQKTAGRMIDSYEKEIHVNKHFISYELCDVMELEMLLTKGEAMFDIVINDIECKPL
jgi:hypothetical protein